MRKKREKIPLTKGEWEFYGVEFMYSKERSSGVPFAAWLRRNYKRGKYKNVAVLDKEVNNGRKKGNRGSTRSPKANAVQKRRRG